MRSFESCVTLEASRFVATHRAKISEDVDTPVIHDWLKHKARQLVALEGNGFLPHSEETIRERAPLSPLTVDVPRVLTENLHAVGARDSLTKSLLHSFNNFVDELPGIVMSTPHPSLPFTLQYQYRTKPNGTAVRLLAAQVTRPKKEILDVIKHFQRQGDIRIQPRTPGGMDTLHSFLPLPTPMKRMQEMLQDFRGGEVLSKTSPIHDSLFRFSIGELCAGTGKDATTTDAANLHNKWLSSIEPEYILCWHSHHYEDVRVARPIKVDGSMLTPADTIALELDYSAQVTSIMCFEVHMVDIRNGQHVVFDLTPTKPRIPIFSFPVLVNSILCHHANPGAPHDLKTPAELSALGWTPEFEGGFYIMKGKVCNVSFTNSSSQRERLCKTKLGVCFVAPSTGNNLTLAQVSVPVDVLNAHMMSRVSQPDAVNNKLTNRPKYSTVNGCYVPHDKSNQSRPTQSSSGQWQLEYKCASSTTKNLKPSRVEKGRTHKQGNLLLHRQFIEAYRKVSLAFLDRAQNQSVATNHASIERVRALRKRYNTHTCAMLGQIETLLAGNEETFDTTTPKVTDGDRCRSNTNPIATWLPDDEDTLMVDVADSEIHMAHLTDTDIQMANANVTEEGMDVLRLIEKDSAYSPNATSQVENGGLYYQSKGQSIPVVVLFIALGFHPIDDLALFITLCTLGDTTADIEKYRGVLYRAWMQNTEFLTLQSALSEVANVFKLVGMSEGETEERTLDFLTTKLIPDILDPMHITVYLANACRRVCRGLVGLDALLPENSAFALDLVTPKHHLDIFRSIVVNILSHVMRLYIRMHSNPPSELSLHLSDLSCLQLGRVFDILDSSGLQKQTWVGLSRHYDNYHVTSTAPGFCSPSIGRLGTVGTPILLTNILHHMLRGCGLKTNDNGGLSKLHTQKDADGAISTLVRRGGLGRPISARREIMRTVVSHRSIHTPSSSRGWDGSAALRAGLFHTSQGSKCGLVTHLPVGCRLSLALTAGAYRALLYLATIITDPVSWVVQNGKSGSPVYAGYTNDTLLQKATESTAFLTRVSDGEYKTADDDFLKQITHHLHVIRAWSSANPTHANPIHVLHRIKRIDSVGYSRPGEQSPDMAVDGTVSAQSLSFATKRDIANQIRGRQSDSWLFADHKVLDTNAYAACLKAIVDSFVRKEAGETSVVDEDPCRFSPFDILSACVYVRDNSYIQMNASGSTTATLVSPKTPSSVLGDDIATKRLLHPGNIETANPAPVDYRTAQGGLDIQPMPYPSLDVIGQIPPVFWMSTFNRHVLYQVRINHVYIGMTTHPLEVRDFLCAWLQRPDASQSERDCEIVVDKQKREVVVEHGGDRIVHWAFRLDPKTQQPLVDSKSAAVLGARSRMIYEGQVDDLVNPWHHRIYEQMWTDLILGGTLCTIGPRTLTCCRVRPLAMGTAAPPVPGEYDFALLSPAALLPESRAVDPFCGTNPDLRELVAAKVDRQGNTSPGSGMHRVFCGNLAPTLYRPLSQTPYRRREQNTHGYGVPLLAVVLSGDYGTNEDGLLVSDHVARSSLCVSRKSTEIAIDDLVLTWEHARQRAGARHRRNLGHDPGKILSGTLGAVEEVKGLRQTGSSKNDNRELQPEHVRFLLPHINTLGLTSAQFQQLSNSEKAAVLERLHLHPSNLIGIGDRVRKGQMIAELLEYHPDQEGDPNFRVADCFSNRTMNANPDGEDLFHDIGDGRIDYDSLPPVQTSEYERITQTAHNTAPARHAMLDALGGDIDVDVNGLTELLERSWQQHTRSQITLSAQEAQWHVVEKLLSSSIDESEAIIRELQKRHNPTESEVTLLSAERLKQKTLRKAQTIHSQKKVRVDSSLLHSHLQSHLLLKPVIRPGYGKKPTVVYEPKHAPQTEEEETLHRELQKQLSEDQLCYYRNVRRHRIVSPTDGYVSSIKIISDPTTSTHSGGIMIRIVISDSHSVEPGDKGQIVGTGGKGCQNIKSGSLMPITLDGQTPELILNMHGTIPSREQTGLMTQMLTNRLALQHPDICYETTDAQCGLVSPFPDAHLRPQKANQEVCAGLGRFALETIGLAGSYHVTSSSGNRHHVRLYARAVWVLRQFIVPCKTMEETPTYHEGSWFDHCKRKEPSGPSTEYSDISQCLCLIDSLHAAATAVFTSVTTPRGQIDGLVTPGGTTGPDTTGIDDHHSPYVPFTPPGNISPSLGIREIRKTFLYLVTIAGEFNAHGTHTTGPACTWNAWLDQVDTLSKSIALLILQQWHTISTIRTGKCGLDVLTRWTSRLETPPCLPHTADVWDVLHTNWVFSIALDFRALVCHRSARETKVMSSLVNRVRATQLEPVATPRCSSSYMNRRRAREWGCARISQFKESGDCTPLESLDQEMVVVSQSDKNSDDSFLTAASTDEQLRLMQFVGIATARRVALSHFLSGQYHEDVTTSTTPLMDAKSDRIDAGVLLAHETSKLLGKIAYTTRMVCPVSGKLFDGVAFHGICQLFTLDKYAKDQSVYVTSESKEGKRCGVLLAQATIGSNSEALARTWLDHSDAVCVVVHNRVDCYQIAQKSNDTGEYECLRCDINSRLVQNNLHTLLDRVEPENAVFVKTKLQEERAGIPTPSTPSEFTKVMTSKHMMSCIHAMRKAGVHVALEPSNYWAGKRHVDPLSFL